MAITITVDNNRGTQAIDPLLLDESAGVQPADTPTDDGNDLDVLFTDATPVDPNAIPPDSNVFDGLIDGLLTPFENLLNAATIMGIAGLRLTDAQKAYAAAVDGAQSSGDFIKVETTAGETINDLFFSPIAAGQNQVWIIAPSGGNPGVPLTTLNDEPIYLYTSGDFAIATTGSTLGAAGARVVAAFYLNENTTDHKTAQIQMVTFEPLKHPDGGDADDQVNWTDILKVSAAGSLSFDFDKLQSGSSLWAAVGNSTEALLVTGRHPVIDANNKGVNPGSDVIHTSQGGNDPDDPQAQPATIGVNNQLFDVDGEAAVFTFVTGFSNLVGADAGATGDYAVDPKPLDNKPEGINYTGYIPGITGAGIFLSQSQGNDPKDFDITVLKTNNTTPESGASYVYNDLGPPRTGDALGDDNAVNVATVTVKPVSGPSVTWVLGSDPDGNGTAFEGNGDTATVGGATVKVTITGNNIDVEGVAGGFTVSWTTTGGDFNRFEVKAEVNAETGQTGKFDIGRVDVLRSVPQSVSVGDKLVVEDDGPRASAQQVTGAVDEDGVIETVGSDGDGIAGGPVGDGDASGESIQATGSVASLFLSGTDTPLSYSLKAVTTGLPLLTSGGATVLYTVVDGTDDTLIAYRSGGSANDVTNQVFTFVLEADGDWTFNLIDQLDHANLNGQTGDNTENDLTIDLSSIIQAKDKDNDAVTAAPNALVITVDDDTPKQTTAKVEGTVDEDGVIETVGTAGDGIAGGPPGDGDVTGEAVTATGNIASLFNTGADEPVTYGLSTTTSGLPSLSSGGVALAYSVTGNTLTAYRSGGSAGNAADQVFTFSITDVNAGAFSFTLIDQLDHDSLDGVAGDDTENDLLIQLGSILQVTDKDGDTITFVPTGTTDGLVITVDDDTPAPAGVVLRTVDEDGIIEDPAAGLQTGDGITGGPPAGGDVVLTPPENVATGNISAAFSSGADEPLTYSLSTDTSELTNMITSGGTPVVFTVVDGANDKLIAYLSGGDPNDPADQVFTLELEPDGDFTFTLIDQFDHVPVPDNVAFEDNVSFQLGKVLLATDKDGDTIKANASGLIITVDDDSPTQTTAKVQGTVDEDGVIEDPAVGAQTGDGIAGGDGDVANEPVQATGSIASLFNSGADEPLTYSLSSVTTGLPSLTSGGTAVLYSVVDGTDDTLIAYRSGGSPNNVTDQVFTFVLEADGDWTFNLIDQLDHDPLTGVGGDNTENDLLIQLGSILQAMDYDGDKITYAPTGTTDGLVITVDDDTGALNGQSVTRHVDEDNMRAGDGDQHDGNEEFGPGPVDIDDGDGTVGEQDEVTFTQGNLQGVVNSGADEPVLFGLVTSVSGAVNSVDPATGITTALTSKGQAVTWTVVGGVVKGVTGAGTPGDLTDDRVVFTITRNANGAGFADDTFTFDLLDQIDHASGSGDLSLLTIDVTPAFAANDFDGDAVDLNGPSNNQEPIRVEVENDVPLITAQIQNSIVDGEVVNDSDGKSLNGAIGGDDNSATNSSANGTKTYTFDSHTTPTNIWPTLDARVSTDATKIEYYESTASNAALVYSIELNQTANTGAGAYTFTVHKELPLQTLEFDFTFYPSGSHLYGVMIDADEQPDLTPDSGLLVVGRNVTLNANGGMVTSSGSTTVIHTSQGSQGPVTIGAGDQMFKPGAGAVFVYLDHPDRNSTATASKSDGLTSTTADDADSLGFEGTLETKTASIEVVQLQSGSTTGMKITAYNLSDDDEIDPAADPLGGITKKNPADDVSTEARAWLDNPNGDVLASGTEVKITEIKVYDTGSANPKAWFTINTTTGVVTDNDPNDAITVVADHDGDANTHVYDFVTVLGFLDNDTIEWKTDQVHDAVLIEGFSGAWDVGGFNIVQGQDSPDQLFQFSVKIRDYDGDEDGTGTDVFDDFSVVVDGTGLNNDGMLTI